MRRISVLLLVALATAGMSVHADTASPAVAAEIISIVKAQWAAGNQKNLAESQKNIADDYTELNGDAATRVDGRALAARFTEAQDKDPGKTLVSEMLNPKVQVYGDVAILSYNYMGYGQDKDGTVKPNRAKSTRVYAKQGGKWLLVHANFAADPLPQN
ncbi:MAG: nuclear transport factor 2 family protein [Gammaproteobacteria bacterium]|nr:nuclear transport factor 2 family protein [Gammaproteobacteria bacterium]